MRGNIWSIVAITLSLAFLPLVLDVDATLGSTRQQIEQLITGASPIMFLAFLVVTLSTIIVFFVADEF